MSKHQNNGYTATESVTEGVVLSVSEKKVEIPAYPDITGINTAVSQIEPILSRLHEKIHAAATVQETVAQMHREIDSEKDNRVVALLLALNSDKLRDMDATMTDSAKRAVSVEISGLKTVLGSIQERLTAIQAVYGKQIVATPKSKSNGSTANEGNITDNNKSVLEELLISRGYSDITFDLTPNGRTYRVSAFNQAGKARATLFTSNVERDWI